ncbi:nitroreductase family deazaflavin-dependent oxidoreductase [Saccharothrix syringae]|uniref:Nitroreductase family deazaflavin-dependent oxidoreductase n=1 Tax=Saccharothrix syringae TaxID=103733 RepID=A0A5Q0H104_SACSY|nr:nitroreductase family deazaflavin-dependent oxidoreductase [Saccharothrix syringae]QFZ19783.1 nitroreductase family deazaflavin-dependent oxidoreductase [Saccharothrix syringae]
MDVLGGRRPASAIRRVVVRVATTTLFARVAGWALTDLDRAVFRLSGGRLVLSRLFFPVLVLTTTGWRSGLARRVPLLCLCSDDGFYVIGSNFGRARHPGWSTNLRHEPGATVTWRGRTFPVTAHPVDADGDFLELLRASGTAPVFGAYAARSGRAVRVFHLRPEPGTGDPAP